MCFLAFHVQRASGFFSMCCGADALVVFGRAKPKRNQRAKRFQFPKCERSMSMRAGGCIKQFD